MGLSGTVDEVLDQSAMWRDHGACHLVLVNLTPMQPSLRRGMTSMPLMAKVIRSVKKL